MARKNEITTEDGLTFVQEKLDKIREGLAMGLTREQACYYADISTSRFYQVLEKNKKHYKEGHRLLDKIEKWEEELNISAKKNIADAIRHENDVDESKWYLEKKGEGFKDSVDVTTDGDKLQQLVVPSELTDKYNTTDETTEEDS